MRAGQRAVLYVVRVPCWCGAVCGAAAVQGGAPEANEVDRVDAVAGGRQGRHVAPPVEARGAEAVDEQEGLAVLRPIHDVVYCE